MLLSPRMTGLAYSQDIARPVVSENNLARKYEPFGGPDGLQV